MKINRRNFLKTSAAAGIIAQTANLSFGVEGSSGKENKIADRQNFSLENKKVTVYTSAENTELRISQTETLSFKPMPQPLETQVCVFVEPKRTFQTFFVAQNSDAFPHYTFDALFNSG